MTTTRLLVELEGNPHPLGRHVEHDDRSRAFAVEHATVAPHPTLWAHTGAVLDQGQLGSCTGNAITQVLATGPLFEKGYKPTEDLALKIYELATTLDSVPGQYPPNDTGSSGLGVAKAARKLGLISSYRHAFGIAQAQATIQRTPFITGTSWHQGMFTPDHHGVIKPTGPVAGGHEYVCLGWDPQVDMWTFLQSWGHWGIGIKGIATTGLFRMHGTDYAALLADQGDITVPAR